MGVCRVAKFVNGLNGRVNGGRKANRIVRTNQIVINCARAADNLSVPYFARATAPRNVPSPPMGSTRQFCYAGGPLLLA